MHQMEVSARSQSVLWLSHVPGLVGEGDSLSLNGTIPWKNWDSVLEGGPSELKEASGNDELRSLATKRRLRRSLNLWIPGHIRHFMTQGIFQSHKKDLRTRP